MESTQFVADIAGDVGDTIRTNPVYHSCEFCKKFVIDFGPKDKAWIARTFSNMKILESALQLHSTGIKGWLKERTLVKKVLPRKESINIKDWLLLDLEESGRTELFIQDEGGHWETTIFNLTQEDMRKGAAEGCTFAKTHLHLVPKTSDIEGGFLAAIYDYEWPFRLAVAVLQQGRVGRQERREIYMSSLGIDHGPDTKFDMITPPGTLYSYSILNLS